MYSNMSTESIIHRIITILLVSISGITNSQTDEVSAFPYVDPTKANYRLFDTTFQSIDLTKIYFKPTGTGWQSHKARTGKQPNH